MATILVVDDEPDIRLLLTIELEGEGHRVVAAGDGTAALAAVHADEPDLVLLDVMMPELDGWGVLARLKTDPDPAVAAIPVVLLTALDQPLDRARGGIEGAVRYLTKPLELDDLQAAVADALAGPEAPQRRRAQHRALEMLARIESEGSSSVATTGPRPRLSRLERQPARGRPLTRPPRLSTAQVDALTDKQRQLVEVLARTSTVMDAATELGMSRSNVYASLRRISRKVGVRSVKDLLELVRAGGPDSP